MSAVDLLFLAVGGFLLGAVAYSGWYTTRYEPEVKAGYAVVGAGAGLVVAINTAVQFATDTSHWFLGATLVGYAIVAGGLTLIVRERRGERR
jgi:hypothetical protein